jgi:hypothetical protein
MIILWNFYYLTEFAASHKKVCKNPVICKQECSSEVFV